MDEGTGAHASQATDCAVGEFVRDSRDRLGWSQSRLADELCRVAARATVTREDVSRWERGKRTPGPFWMPHLAAALDVPLSILECERVKRRAFIASVATAAIATATAGTVAGEMFASLANGDFAPLSTVQTSHTTDLLLSGMVVRDRVSLFRIAKWMDEGESDVLRVNSAGILAKTVHPDLLDSVPLALERDSDMRNRYLSAVRRRVGIDIVPLTRELGNPNDAGARWCAGYLLKDEQAGRRALSAALRTEPVRENIRAFALMLETA